MLFAYTNATLLLKWSKERSDVQTQVSKGKKSESFFECLFDYFLKLLKGHDYYGYNISIFKEIVK